MTSKKLYQASLDRRAAQRLGVWKSIAPGGYYRLKLGRRAWVLVRRSYTFPSQWRAAIHADGDDKMTLYFSTLKKARTRILELLEKPQWDFLTRPMREEQRRHGLPEGFASRRKRT